ncbi:hypothetical protein RIF29_25333 [Crotalaria pallida]|uniref:Pentatricopeptide repeat-containing protein n=1 Tax=Crotalaria pallida TaxID=3830 RepID=A0AAN9I102_CROPI
MSPKEAVVWKAEQSIMKLFKQQCSSMKHLKEFHAHIIHAGFHQNTLVLGKILVFCAASSSSHIMNYALSIFDSIHKPDAFLCNTMIRGFGNNNQPHNAIHFYQKMHHIGVRPDSFTFTFLHKIVSDTGLGSITLRKQLHCNILKLGLETHSHITNSLMHMYGMLKDIQTAHHLFEEMLTTNATSTHLVVAWNSIIHCHAYCRSYKEALNPFTRMLQSGRVQPDDATLVVTLAACGANVHCMEGIKHQWC